MIQTAWVLIRAEAIKLRRTQALWLIVMAPMLAITIELINLFNLTFLPVGDSNALWRNLLNGGWNWWLLFVAPIFISFEAAFLANLEHSGKHWKQLFACPIPRWGVYLVKLLFCHLLVSVGFLVVLLGFTGDVLIFSSVRGLHLASAIPWLEILSTASKAYIAFWLAITIQSWLSWRLSGMITPIGIGFAALIVGLMLLPLHHGDLSSWHPWTLAFRALQVNSSRPHNTELPVVFGGVGGLLLGGIACWNTSRKWEGD